MRVFLICGAFLNKRKILSDSIKTVDNAADNFSIRLINGFSALCRNNFECVNASFIGSFPSFYKNPFFHGIGRHDNIVDINFLNIFAIRNISRYIRIRKVIKDQIRDSTDKQICIISYSLHAPFIYALKYAKRINPDIRTCVIVPDLPEMMNLQKRSNPIKSALKYADTRLIYKNLKKIDYYVLLTRHMKDYLHLEDDRCDIIEGIVSESELRQFLIMRKPITESKAILYAGTLNYIYGVMDLVNAFMKIDNSQIQLWICGNGEAASQIKKAARQDKRIIYFGNLDKDSLNELYGKAFALVNPRPPLGEYTLYSFPSKILEYLSTGVPTISYFLPGMPEEYKQYIFEIETIGPEGIYESLIEFLNTNYDKLLNIAKEAQIFLLENKTEKKQGERILSLIWRENGK